MSEQAKQQQTLHNAIWKMAHSARGSVSAWDFKEFVLGALFYRFVSESIQRYFDMPGAPYASLKDSDVDPDVIADCVSRNGFFIPPSHLFTNVQKNSLQNEDINTFLSTVLRSIESSATGTKSEEAIQGLFADFETVSNKLGNTVKERNSTIAKLLQDTADLPLGEYGAGSHDIDLLGDAYEFIISKYAANAGKSGGEYFTPQSVSELLLKITAHNNHIETIYDPACGSGSLLLQAKNLNDEVVGGPQNIRFFGQEKNQTTYNLSRMNMLLHGVGFDRFSIKLGDTLTSPKHVSEETGEPIELFDAIVSNPPYSIKWDASKDATLINDPRYSPAGVLAPDSKADFAFIMHSLKHLAATGKAAIVCFPGIFYRGANSLEDLALGKGAAEQKIRKYLVDNNFVEAIISLPSNMFFGTGIATTILVLSKSKKDNSIRFIDASSFFKKDGKQNILTADNISDIMTHYTNGVDAPHISKLVSNSEVENNLYNLSVSSYVEAENLKDVVDIKAINAEADAVAENVNKLRQSIREIIRNIEGDNV